MCNFAKQEIRFLEGKGKLLVYPGKLLSSQCEGFIVGVSGYVINEGNGGSESTANRWRLIGRSGI